VNHEKSKQRNAAKFAACFVFHAVSLVHFSQKKARKRGLFCAIAPEILCGADRLAEQAVYSEPVSK
jgi:hypothetical protein